MEVSGSHGGAKQQQRVFEVVGSCRQSLGAIGSHWESLGAVGVNYVSLPNQSTLPAAQVRRRPRVAQLPHERQLHRALFMDMTGQRALGRRRQDGWVAIGGGLELHRRQRVHILGFGIFTGQTSKLVSTN